MIENFIQRKASINDLKSIVALLVEDELGSTRDRLSEELDPKYLNAFKLIDKDPNQYLMVVEKDNQIIATCHLTIMPSLTFTGSTRMQIEAVRVSEKLRGQKIGEWMIERALEYGRENNVGIIQLSTNKKRPRAKKFYEKLGFEASHEGMKLYLKGLK
ncbi:Acetyltransferase (GNAT) family protein [Candidatus Arcanobacter lacustris]|uniref:Acetyltransferase (GNAT) family protein n=1 Tax=Candidatus Arcanibacter lacustris TaxID=1607817 RepID=A0A0F5MMU4_9RICK|nr:Acetyltransferase (GNAT) family protein [Candidatus Arcanobacter lacustris]